MAVSVAGAGDTTLTATNGASDQARNAVVELTGVVTGNANVIVPTAAKKYTIYNNTTGAFTRTVKTSAGSGVLVPQGRKMTLYCDGTNVVEDLSALTNLMVLDHLDTARGDVASAGTTDIWNTGGNYAVVTGSATITSFGTAPQLGAWRLLRFVAGITLTHSSNLQLPTGANIVTQSDDFALVVSNDTVTQHKALFYLRGNGASLGVPSNVALKDAANTFTLGQSFADSNAMVGTVQANAALQLTLTEAGANTGPTLNMLRDSATPAASDFIGIIQLGIGRDSAANVQAYGDILGQIIDPTNGSEDAQFFLRAIVAGSFQNELIYGNGVQLGAPTGGAKGTGTINAASGLYDNNHRVATRDQDNAFSTAQNFADSNAMSGTVQANAALQLLLTEAGANQGPTLNMWRDSASPAASDSIGIIQLGLGRDSAANVQDYGSIRADILDPTNGSEDSQIAVRTAIAGTTAEQLYIGNGLQVGVGGASGGYKGDGTIHVKSGYYATLVDASSGFGPPIELYRDSASPAASDPLGYIDFYGKDSNGNKTEYALIYAAIQDPTDTTEAGRLEFATRVGGATSSRMTLGHGLVVGGASGGDSHGGGAINAVAVYDDNVLLTDYVFDQAADGRIDETRYAHINSRGRNVAAAFERASLDVDWFSDYWRQHRHFPNIPGMETWTEETRPGIGEMAQMLLEVVEVQAVHIAGLNERLKRLEAHLGLV